MQNTLAGLLEKIKSRAEGRITGFYFGSTSTGVFDDGGYYTTPIRETSSLIYAGVIVRNVEIARSMSFVVDGKVDYIFVDAEKKIDSLEMVESGYADLEKNIKNSVSDSRVATFKGNDLAAQSFDDLIGILVDDFSKTSFTVIGAGNVGTKVAQKIMERGAHVTLYRRNEILLDSIVNSLNVTKPGCIVARAKSASCIKDACRHAHVIVACANQQGIVSLDDINVVDEKIPLTLIDVGKGCFAEGLVNSNRYNIHRLDISTTQKHHFSSLVEISRFYAKPIGKKVIHGGDIVLVSQGLLAGNGEFVVDDIESPRRLLGIADGKGSFIKDYRLFDEKIRYLADNLKIMINY